MNAWEHITHSEQRVMETPNQTTVRLEPAERNKLRRDKSKEAVDLALKGEWEQAVDVNRDILEFFPEEVEAWNRLGKAFLELGSYDEAQGAFETASHLAPYNTISKKNLERISHLREIGQRKDEGLQARKAGKSFMPYMFIEESGKSEVTSVGRPAPGSVLAKLASGDSVKLATRDHSIIVENGEGEYLGQVEPKLSKRLIRLIKGGNRYDAAVISVSRQELSIIIWEIYKHPTLHDVCSFPTRQKDDRRVYWVDSLARYDGYGDMDEDDEYSADWREPDADSLNGTEEVEPSEEPFSRPSVKVVSEEDEE